MPTKPWPKVPNPPGEEVIDGCFGGAPYIPPKPPFMTAERYPVNAECKHGKGSCELCGTTDRRDRVHKTEGGLGAVGKLRRRRS